MDLSDLIVDNGVLPNLKATSKKQVLQHLAAKAAEVFDLDERTILDLLMERERLGTTGVGNGGPGHAKHRTGYKSQPTAHPLQTPREAGHDPRPAGTLPGHRQVVTAAPFFLQGLNEVALPGD